MPQYQVCLRKGDDDTDGCLAIVLQSECVAFAAVDRIVELC